MNKYYVVADKYFIFIVIGTYYFMVYFKQNVFISYEISIFYLQQNDNKRLTKRY